MNTTVLEGKPTREDGEGEIRMRILRDRLPFFADMIWGLGEDARIVEPEEVVHYMAWKIGEMKELYSPDIEAGG